MASCTILADHSEMFIATRNNPEYGRSLDWLQLLMYYIRKCLHFRKPSSPFVTLGRVARRAVVTSSLQKTLKTVSGSEYKGITDRRRSPYYALLPQYEATKSRGKYALYLINTKTSNNISGTEGPLSTFRWTSVYPYTPTALRPKKENSDVGKN